MPAHIPYLKECIYRSWGTRPVDGRSHTAPINLFSEDRMGNKAAATHHLGLKLAGPKLAQAELELAASERENDALQQQTATLKVQLDACQASAGPKTVHPHNICRMAVPDPFKHTRRHLAVGKVV